MNKKNILTSLILMMIIFSTFIYGCVNNSNPNSDPTIINPALNSSNQPEIKQHIDLIRETPIIFNNVVDANNEFATDIYSIYKSEEGNLFFSPYSISSALAMTYEGAKGQTAEEMRRVLHLPEDINIVRADFESIYSQINAENKPYLLNTANSIWAQEDYPFIEEYLTNVEKYYDGKATNVDFKKDAEKSRRTINSWIEDKTNSRIKDLIPKNKLNEETRMVLVNTIYFKANWSNQFKLEGTTNDLFKVTPEKTKRVKMMHQMSQFNYGENEKMQILEMNYVEEDLSMLIILPKEDINSLESEFSIEKLNEWKNSMTSQRVNVAMPKFKFETKYFMTENLKQLGMSTAFNESSADFTGMYDSSKLDETMYISEVIHQTFIEVAEYGSEAAAATAVIMVGTTSIEVPVEPKIFTADHPFIFVIQQKESGNILFMGRVSNPNE